MKNGVEYVVLVDEEDQEIGIENKLTVHTQKTPLHRTFSLFLFKNTKELLLQQRVKKKHGPLYGQIPVAVTLCRKNLIKVRS